MNMGVSPRGWDIILPAVPWKSVVRHDQDVVLPVHLDWSPAGRRRSLSSDAVRWSVYGQILAQGTPKDVVFWVDIDVLVAGWDSIWLPPYLKRQWSTWLDQMAVSA